MSSCIFADDNPKLFTSKDEITENSEEKKPILFWWNIGMGGSNIGMSGLLSTSLQFDRKLISIRYLDNAEFLFDIFEKPTVETFDVGVLYGKVLAKGKFSFASIAGGISYVGGVKRGEFLYRKGITDYYEEVYIQTIGIPIELQSFLTLRLIGVGIYGFANLNPRNTFWGFTFCLQLGKLRHPLS
jgi:hypothetical protein